MSSLLKPWPAKQQQRRCLSKNLPKPRPVARAGAAVELITSQQAVMQKSEEVIQSRLKELEELIEIQVEPLKDRMQEEIDKTSAELERRDEATEAAITTAQRCMMEAQATAQASASERLTKEIMDSQVAVQELLRPTRKGSKKRT